MKTVKTSITLGNKVFDFEKRAHLKGWRNILRQIFDVAFPECPINFQKPHFKKDYSRKKCCAALLISAKCIHDG